MVTTLVLSSHRVVTVSRVLLCIYNGKNYIFVFLVFILQAISYEITYGGLSFDTMTVGEFPPLACLIMLMVDTVLYLILAIYFSNVIPGKQCRLKG